MGFGDMWFIDMRNTNRNIRRYILWLVALFVFVTIGVIVCIKSMYRPIVNYEVQTTYPAVEVTEAKRTNVNGYIKGQIKNTTEEDMNIKYIKFEFYTKNDINIGNEYIEIGTLKPLETKTYEVKFRYPKVERFVICMSELKE